MIAWRAFRNMLRAAARDPVWAIVAIILGPFRAAKYVFGVLIVALLVMLVLGFGTELLGNALGLSARNPIRAVLSLGAALVTLVAIFRMVTNPMINHFGDRPDATHGSAR
ncbi:MAG: type IV secretory system conjugative DNA transfer family protein, partial [Chthonomonadales bacterium]|nr:type IV secretory system conjugative DNA transfer family protein [Chthonomonadales bacterium]